MNSAHTFWRHAVVLSLIYSMLPAEVRSAETDLRVMSFNVWSAEDSAAGRQGIVNVIRQSNADLVGLQEMSSAGLTAVANSLGFYSYSQGLGSEAILSRYRIVATAPSRYGALVEIAPGHEAWLFNTHLFHAPYGPYQLNGIAYFGGPIYDPSIPANISRVIADQVAARGTEVQSVLRTVRDTQAMTSGQPIFLTGDFNEASHLDWTADAVAAGIHVADVAWPASTAITATGWKDSWREVYPDEVAYPGRTWSPVYPSTYMNAGDDPRVQPRPIPEPQDRIDIVYYAGNNVTPTGSQRSGPLRGDQTEELEISGYPSDHNAITSTFRVTGLDDTRLTFRALGTNGSLIPKAYGNRPLSSPNVVIDYVGTGGANGESATWKAWTDANWPDGVALLDSGSGESADGTARFDLLLRPDAGFGVRLDSFRLLDYNADATGQTIEWEVLVDGMRLAEGIAEVADDGELDINPMVGSSAFSALELRLRHMSGINNELGLDNVVFSQVVVPEPTALGVAISLLVGVALRRRGLK